MTSDPLPSDSKNQASSTGKRKFWFATFFGVAVLGLTALLCIAGVLAYFLFQNSNQLADVVTDVKHSTGLAAEIVELNQIAYIGNDNNVYVVSPDGQNLQALTEDGGRGAIYRFPTWAPDGQHIAYLGPSEGRGTALFVSPTDEVEPRILFDSTVSAPFYLYWSPNGQDITFLTQEASGLSMRLASLDEGVKGRVLEEGAPFYWSWSPGSDQLLMHVGGSRAFSDEAHLSLLDNITNAERVELESAPGRFQAPIWSSDGTSAFFVAENSEGEDTIFQMNTTTFELESLAELEGIGQTFMVVSPDGKHIAYLESDLNRPIPLGTPNLVDVEAGIQEQITGRSVMSMYWSPDSKKLAMLTADVNDDEPAVRSAGLAAPQPQEVNFRWWSYNVDEGTLTELMEITPTADFAQTVPYFDQYHLSLTFWSPNSRYFVATTQASEAGGGQVMVLDAVGDEAPLQVGEGRIAVWSWK